MAIALDLCPLRSDRADSGLVPDTIRVERPSTDTLQRVRPSESCRTRWTRRDSLPPLRFAGRRVGTGDGAQSASRLSSCGGETPRRLLRVLAVSRGDTMARGTTTPRAPPDTTRYPSPCLSDTLPVAYCRALAAVPWPRCSRTPDEPTAPCSTVLPMPFTLICQNCPSFSSRVGPVRSSLTGDIGGNGGGDGDGLRGRLDATSGRSTALPVGRGETVTSRN
mmetsp:Transcript_40450/g.87550  ORF Transcript_40450/g.87550 Transcript_40450/m.87550 type:complete len:221 (+) Transcript_40450:622-1284(+)